LPRRGVGCWVVVFNLWWGHVLWGYASVMIVNCHDLASWCVTPIVDLQIGTIVLAINYTICSI